MANALQSNMTLPDAPEQSGQPMPQGGQQQQIPQPTHAQTVATLRHLGAIKRELMTLMKNPDLGKSDMKSAIIDGVTKLVADRIIPATTAVTKLATVPERPFDQKKFVEQDYLQTMQAESAILDHHRSHSVGAGDYELENKLHSSNPDNHMQDISSMMQAHYGKK